MLTQQVLIILSRREIQKSYLRIRMPLTNTNELPNHLTDQPINIHSRKLHYDG
jgi:hypothetical protein